jgi:hypothetical protein
VNCNVAKILLLHLFWFVVISIKRFDISLVSVLRTENHVTMVDNHAVEAHSMVSCSWYENLTIFRSLISRVTIFFKKAGAIPLLPIRVYGGVVK